MKMKSLYKTIFGLILAGFLSVSGFLAQPTYAEDTPVENTAEVAEQSDQISEPETPAETPGENWSGEIIDPEPGTKQPNPNKKPEETKKSEGKNSSVPNNSASSEGFTTHTTKSATSDQSNSSQKSTSASQSTTVATDDTTIDTADTADTTDDVADTVDITDATTDDANFVFIPATSYSNTYENRTKKIALLSILSTGIVFFFTLCIFFATEAHNFDKSKVKKSKTQKKTKKATQAKKAKKTEKAKKAIKAKKATKIQKAEAKKSTKKSNRTKKHKKPAKDTNPLLLPRSH